MAPKKRKAEPQPEPSSEEVVAEEVAQPSAKKAAVEKGVNPRRIRPLKAGSYKAGPVVYWMSRDQRVDDNWALLYALEQAAKGGAPVAIAFNLVPAFLGAGARHFGFMLRGLKELAAEAEAKGIAFFMLQGDPVETLPRLVSDTKAGLLVTDYSPMRIGRQWRRDVSTKLPEGVPFHEVDAHNVVPVWVASDKRETAARTIRPKIHKNLPEYLKEYPPTPEPPSRWRDTQELRQPEPVDWDALIAEVLTRGSSVPEVTWVTPGEAAARLALDGPQGFLSPARLRVYSDKRNDPAVQALSNLSPYLHYGQLSPQRAALEASKHRSKFKEAAEGFLEELVVRRELADNFCEYTPNYDQFSCAAGWAQETLNNHRRDKREYLYTRQQLEEGKTHDELWNACQLEMVHLGKMHGYMRMYWAKKILEWTASPEEAIEVAIYLNDKYELDGRDPNGYVGVMWSMVGIHDMGWTERPIFGKIRYMNYAGCKRKFDIAAYVAYVNRAIKAELAKQKERKQKAAGGSASGSGAPAGGAAAAAVKSEPAKVKVEAA